MNFGTLDLNLLRVFDTLMTHGSLTRTAEALSITQPAASHALKRLHESVGETLFTRSAQGMVPTARSVALWPQIRHALNELEQALAPSRFDPQTDRMQFRLMMSDAPAAVLAPNMVAELRAQRVVSDLRFQPLVTRDPRQVLLDGETDIAVGHFPGIKMLIDGAGDRPSILHETLYQSGFVCVMRRDHPMMEGELTLERYCAADHLLFSLAGRSRGSVDDVLNALGHSRRIVLTVNQYQTAGRVLVRSDLVTVLPMSLMGAVGYRDRLATRPIPFELAPLAVEMMWSARRDREPAQQWLRELVRQTADFS